MATIVIKDLPDSSELDRQAMAAITGGARSRGRTGISPRVTGMFHKTTIFPLPAGYTTRRTQTGKPTK